MKPTTVLFILLAFLSAASGYLMSKSSWIGKVGMTFFHKGYNLTKIWWQGAAAVFILFILLYLLHSFLHKKFSIIAGRVLHLVILLTVITGLYFTNTDFTNDFAHHLLGWRFHYGFYLIWLGWMIVCLFFLLKKKDLQLSAIGRDKKEQATG